MLPKGYRDKETSVLRASVSKPVPKGETSRASVPPIGITLINQMLAVVEVLEMKADFGLRFRAPQPLIAVKITNSIRRVRLSNPEIPTQMDGYRSAAEVQYL